MEIKGLNLDSSPYTSEDKSLKYACNIIVSEDNTSYMKDYSTKFLEGITLDTGGDICGIITTTDGFVCFIKGTSTDSIKYYINKESKLILKKHITSSYFNFNTKHPITGDYTYNYKNELIVTFTEGVDDECNETRIININNPTNSENSSDIYINLNDNDSDFLNIIPSVSYPELKFNILNYGSLKTGAYQIAIKYKLPDNTYTNYSILYKSVIISGDYNQDFKVGETISKSIEVSFINNDTKYTYYKLAIVYIDEESQLAYETQDIKIVPLNKYVITNIKNYESITLEDIFVNNIAYIKDKCHVNFNNRLIRANVKTLDYKKYDTLLSTISKEINIKYEWVDKSSIINSDIKYFKGNEVYSIYIGFFDYKGHLINIYKIPHKTGDDTLNNYSNHFIQNKVDKVALLNVVFTQDTYNKIPNTIKQCAIFSVQHDLSNSRILSQAIALRDTAVNNFSSGQKFEGQFDSKVKTRLYPFELLYNIKPTITGALIQSYTIPNTLIKNEGDLIPEEYRCVVNVNEATSSLNVKLSDLKETSYGRTFGITADYIASDNSQVDNITGDSYYRHISEFGKETDEENLITGNNKFSIVEITNIQDNFYSNEYNQKLEIISSIHIIQPNYKIQCTGDTMLSYLTLRATTPATGYTIGSDKTKESNAYVWRWIFTVPIESKFNIKARFSLDSINKTFKLNDSSINKRLPLYGLSYKNDNLINTSVGKGYSLIYNENGIQDYIYFDKITTINNHNSRIIRSNIFNIESDILSWRYYSPNEYKDIPLNRGDIISLKTDNRTLYIQQQFGLRIAILRDVLSNTDDGTSYLGSSDIFDREPVEVLYSPTGYIGCNSYYDTHINITGYYVYDSTSGKIFNIFNNTVSEITNVNCKNWFYLNKPSDNTENNPFYKTLINGSYYSNYRYFNYNEHSNVLTFVKVEHNLQNSYSITFNTNVKKWISFNDYKPVFGINNKYGTLWFDENTTGQKHYRCHIVDITKCGSWFNNTNCYIKFLLNRDVYTNKLLNNITWKSRTIYRLNNPAIIKPFNTCNSLFVHNDTQCTNLKAIKFNTEWYSGEQGVNKIGLWKYNNIQDVAKDTNFLLNEYQLNTSSLKQNPKWYNLNAFISQFVYVVFYLDINESEYDKIEIHDVDAEWIIDNRN